MPRYYFIDSEHVSEIAPDHEGLEFHSFEEACKEADLALREISVHTKARTLWVSVFDEERKPVHRARLEVISEHWEC